MHVTPFEGRGFSCKKVVEYGQPVLAVYHDLDGDWQMLCGGDEHVDDSQILVIHPSHLIDRDKTLAELADLPAGYMASRTSLRTPWSRSETARDEDEDSDDLAPEDAIPIYRAMLEEKPEDPVIWFDLGLALKRIRDWPSCIEANQRALQVTSEREDPAWWNLGIAATAVRNWEIARVAWRGYGLEIPDGTGPIECDYGSSPVRLSHGEIVWGPRIDPARVIVRNVPLPESGYRWGDIVLHDGAPNGEREVDGTVYSVFDVLERWSPSEIPTYRLEVTCSTDADVKALIEAFEAKGFGAEEWTTNVRQLCKACSEGRQSGHDHPFDAGGAMRSIGIACPLGLVSTILQEWIEGSPSTRAHGTPVHVG